MIRHTSSISFLFRKLGTLFLAFSLLLGLFLGNRLHIHSEASIASLMRVSGIRNVSIVSHVSVLLLPFFFSAFISGTRAVWMIFPISFLKGLTFGFSQATLCSSFVGAGWLIYFFLMFSNIMSLPVLVFFWIHSLSRNARTMSQLTYCMLAVLLIVAVDYHFISPYCVSLFT